MSEVYDPRDRLEDYRIYLLKKILRLKTMLDRGYRQDDLENTIDTLRQLEADLFKLRNVGALLEMRRAA